jgi:ATP-dependent Clp protease ATP-binding subunit ClpA
MKFNPAEISIAYVGGDNFSAVTPDGKTAYRMQTTEAEGKSMLGALQATGLFSPFDGKLLMINPQQVTRVFSTGDTLKVTGAGDKTVLDFTLDATTAGKNIETLAKDAPVWVKVPGIMSAISAHALGQVRYVQDKLEFLSHDGKALETSGPVSQDIAAGVIAKAKAAIEACKALRQAAPIAAAANAEPAAYVKPTPEERSRLKNLFNALKDVVFGQDEPLQALAEAVRRARAGLQEENKPMGSFLFLGPTGVGKTESARQLAKALGYDFKKFDMSEYVAKIDASRLTGGSPNYVGYEEGGQLINWVREHPKSVLLFDEIEKAHPDVANVLLQVLDDAVLTDGKGRVARFQDTIIILTSNLGTRFKKKGPMGFAAKEDADSAEPGEERKSEDVQAHFLAEFMNRLTDVIRFKPLTPAVMLKMVGRLVGELAGRMKKSDADLTVTPAAQEWLAVKGYDPEFGARPLKREMEKLSNPLSDEILFGKLQDGGVAQVDVARGLDGVTSLSYAFNEAIASNDNKNAATAAQPISRKVEAPVPAGGAAV